MRNDGNSFSVSTRVHSNNANKDDLKRLVFKLFEFLLGEEWFVWRMNDVNKIMLIFGYENEDKLDTFSYERSLTPDICEKIKDDPAFLAAVINVVYVDCLFEEEFTKIIDKINKVTLTIYCKDLSEDVSSDVGVNGDGEEIL